MSSLKELKMSSCKPCKKGDPALTPARATDFLAQLEGWFMNQSAKMIWRDYLMADFLAATRLINQVAEIAEAEDHHPDIHLTGYRRLKIELSTHSIGGLSENDFIVAAKIESLPKELKKEA